MLREAALISFKDNALINFKLNHLSTLFNTLKVFMYLSTELKRTTHLGKLEKITHNPELSATNLSKLSTVATIS